MPIEPRTTLHRFNALDTLTKDRDSSHASLDARCVYKESRLTLREYRKVLLCVMLLQQVTK